MSVGDDTAKELRGTHRSVLLVLYALAAMPCSAATLFGLAQALGMRSTRSVRRVVRVGLEMGYLQATYRKDGTKLVGLSVKSQLMLVHFFRQGTSDALRH